ncbi:hypothetical protein [Synechococcus sp. NOUM97013]|uniref:hypothetical protein n=1 Tax=Synechococcus sp. NOUM97013 TaxID=1442555 RepID=UPI0016464C1B|nr:hypothetical protein [Synechococcus sp. NOUM97013]
MSLLNMSEKPASKKFLGIGCLYVLNLSDRIFSVFAQEAASFEIQADDCTTHGTSKEKKFRAFLNVESNYLVGSLLNGLIGENNQVHGKVTALTDPRKAKVSINDLDAHLVSKR